jgi:hypothetical protein
MGRGPSLQPMDFLLPVGSCGGWARPVGEGVAVVLAVVLAVVAVVMGMTRGWADSSSSLLLRVKPAEPNGDGVTDARTAPELCIKHETERIMHLVIKFKDLADL